MLTPEQKLDMEFQRAIEAVGKRHHLTPEQSTQALLQAIGNNKSPLFAYGKGGVSTLGRGVYVVNDPGPNTVIAAKKRWVSSRGNAKELVIVSGSSRITSVPIPEDGLSDDLIFILFDGRRIRFYDWMSLMGATVYREPVSAREAAH